LSAASRFETWSTEGAGTDKRFVGPRLIDRQAQGKLKARLRPVPAFDRRPPMRLPLIAPENLTPEQKSLYDAMRQGIASNFNDFKVLREDGALMGPWNPWLHEPAIGKAIWDLTMAMTANATLPDNVRQIVILVVGARYDAAYAIYAHIAVAEREGMKPARLAALVADLKPTDLTAEENVAFDLAYKLVRGSVLPEPLYRLAIETFGQKGTNEMIYLVGLYALVATTLNGFNVPVPERE
jgi:4-carboxymuconolactone decarboxylase